MKEYLRHFDFLVIFYRWIREVLNAWKRVDQAYQDEKDRTITLIARQEIVKSYIETATCRKLQIGTGTNPFEDWLNTDLEPLTPSIAYLDVIETFPFKDNVFEYVFSEHMIEHINYKDGLFMLSECYRVLKPRGKIRIATPNLEQIIGLYRSKKTDVQRRYLEWSSQQHMGLYSPDLNEFQSRRSEWAIDHNHIERFYPDSGQDTACFVVNNFFHSYGHKFLYDSKSLRAILEEVGFVDVVDCKPGMSDDVNLLNLESHHRLIGEEMNLFETMILEASRP